MSGPLWRQLILRFRRIGLAGALLVTACGTELPTEPGSCDHQAPTMCPAQAPSYARDVEPLLVAFCRGCHTAGGVAAVHPFDTYEQVQAWQVGIRIQVDACIMPPADQAQPTSAERELILAWIACGAAND